MGKDSDFVYYDDDEDEQHVKPVNRKKRSPLKSKLSAAETLVLSSSEDSDNEALSPRVANKKGPILNKGKGKARVIESSDEEQAPPAKKPKQQTKEEQIKDLDEAVRVVVQSVNTGSMSRLELISAKMDLQRRARTLGVNWSAQYAHHFGTPAAVSTGTPAPSTPAPGTPMQSQAQPDVKPRVSSSTDDIIRRAEEAARARVNRTPYETHKRKDRVERQQADALDLAHERRRKRLEAERKQRQQRAAKLFDSDDEDKKPATAGPSTAQPPPATAAPQPTQVPWHIPAPEALLSQSSDSNDPLPAPTQNPFALPNMARRRRDDEEDDDLGMVTQEDIDAFDRLALMPEFEKSRKVNEAVAELGLNNQTDRIPGTRFTLVPFQYISVNWMIKQERGSWYGGVLGDEMGLGKTVQALAVAMLHRSSNPETKTNLIVCPLALLYQWESEIMSKCIGQTVHIYHGSNPNKVKRADDLMKFDFVIMTSSTLALEWEDPNKSFKDNGILFGCLWYRVILDEAHGIRNRSTRLSKAVSKLDSVFRWALTGSPFVNNLADYFPLFRFLRIRPWCSWVHYNEMICKREKKEPKYAASVAERAFRPIIIRRRKTDLLDGKPLVKLEPKTVEFVPQVFDAEEREIYDAAESRAQIQIGRYIKRGSLLKNMAHIFSLLLRLRQICVHPGLIATGGESDGEYLKKELDRARSILGVPRVIQIQRGILDACVDAERERRQFEEAECDDEEDGIDVGQECPICFDPIQKGVGIITRCGHAFCRECILNIINGDPFENDADVEQIFRCKEGEQPCPNCRRPVSEAGFFDYDAFCPTVEQIEEELEKEASGSGHREERMKIVRSAIMLDDDDDELPDLATIADMTAPKYVKEERVKAKIAMKKKSAARNIDRKPDVSSSTELVKFGASTDKGKGVDRKPMIASSSRLQIEDAPAAQAVDARVEAKHGQAFKATGGSRRHVDEDEEDDMELIVPSTKMQHILKMLKDWKVEDPTIKTIIVSQFTSALDLLDSYLTSNKIRCVRFQGDCSADDRKEAVRRLKEDSKVRVMLLSLKAGGVGLNLVSACRVISLDIAWSPAIEAQAFDRVHRLGQTKPVLVQRLIVADSVEERIKLLQERKQTLSDLTLTEGVGTAENRDNVSIPELLGLFRLDTHGRKLDRVMKEIERDQVIRDVEDGLLNSVAEGLAPAPARPEAKPKTEPSASGSGSWIPTKPKGGQ